jgi:Outer membrane protein beta-barrel domain
MTFAGTAQAQFSLGVQGGIGIDTDETVGGILARYSFGKIQVGANLDFGKWKETFEVGFGKGPSEFEEEGSVVHFNIPVAYMFALGEGAFSIFPFVQFGIASYSIDDCDGCDSESETTFDGGIGAMYNIFFVNASFNLLGEENGSSSTNIRGGVLFGL